MQVSILEIERIAEQSRLKLTEQEKMQHKKNVEAFLLMAQCLSKIDTKGVPALIHLHDIYNVFREDEIMPSMENTQLMANAPEHDNGCFIVPKVVE